MKELNDQMKKQENKNDMQDRIITIPNILSSFRFVLIPIFVWLYCVKKDYMWTTIVLVISGITDMLDGFIARHFNMSSNLGKIIDPIADKLTQAAMLFCLCTRFPLMIVPLVLLFMKEIFMGITGYMAIQKTGKVKGARWHGKVATFLLDIMMILHVIWFDIPAAVSNTFIVVCIIMMIVSLILYGIQNIKAVRGKE